MRDVKYLAIFTGLAVDIGCSLGCGMVLGILMVIYHLSQGVPAPKLLEVMDGKHLAGSVPFLVTTLGLGGFGSLLGGFVTGWLAKVSEMKNASITGILSILLSVFFWNMYPIWYNAAGCLFTVGPAIAGGFFSHVIFGHRPPPA
jgi:hypothetical protein